jgi:hypothetical protein
MMSETDPFAPADTQEVKFPDPPDEEKEDDDDEVS